MKKPGNFFSAGVCFKTHAYSIHDLGSGNDAQEVTPEIVLSELEDFCRRVRRDLTRTDDAVGQPDGQPHLTMRA